MIETTVQKYRSWAVPVLLGLLLASVTFLGSQMTATLGRMEAKMDHQAEQISANTVCCAELRTRVTVENERRRRERRYMEGSRP